MRILELSLRNYRVFEEVDLELPARVIGIFGPNGSGKSTLVESVLWALYGRARTDKKHIRTHGLLTDCAVRVAFEHGGQQYEVRRTIRGKGHQTDAELLVGGLVLANGVQEVDGAIRGLLRMDQQVFRASVFAEQKQLDAFSDVTPGKRKDMVMRLLGIQPVDQALGRARREVKETKKRAQDLAGSLPDTAVAEDRLEAAREEAEEARSRADAAAAAMAEAAERLGQAERDFDEHDALRQRLEKLQVQREGVEAQVVRVQERRRDLEGRIAGAREHLDAAVGLEDERGALRGAEDRLRGAQRLVEASQEARRLEAQLAALPETDPAAALGRLQEAEARREAAGTGLARAEAAHEAARRELASAGEALARADRADPSEPCPTCGRPLGEDFREYVAHCRRRVEDLEDRSRASEAELQEARGAWRAADRVLQGARGAGEEARRGAEARAAVAERLGSLNERVAVLAEAFGGTVPDLGPLEDAARRAAEVDRLLARLEAERAHLVQHQRDLARVDEEGAGLRERLEEVRREMTGLAFDAEEHARLRKERDESRRLLDSARTAEREASDAHKASEARVGELEAEIRKVREIAARVRDIREQARILDRVSVLLDDFRDHLVARIGPELSREAQVLFRELTNAEYEDLRIDEETLAIQIADGADYFAMERFSGSETDLANLALRAAISLHLSRMSGTDVGMMVLDEVLASLDAERKDLFVQTMGRLAAHVHQLFVITHAEQVKDQFPASIEVRKVGRRRSRACLW